MSAGPRSTLERRLAAVLVELRPTTGAPERLRTRIASIPAHSGQRRWLLLPTLVAAATVASATAIVLVVGVYRPSSEPPPGSGSAPPATFDPTLAGPGIVTSVVPWLTIVPMVVAIAIGIIGLRWALRWRWHNLVIRLGLVALAAGPIAALAAHPGFEMGSASAPRLGYGIVANGPPGAEDVRVFYATAEPGGPIMIAMTIRNPGPLPIKVEGLVETQGADTPLVSRWTALWVPRDRTSVMTDYSGLEPFHPATVQPGEEFEIGVVGVASQCAYGPAYTLETQVGAWAERSSTLTFVFSVLGLTSTSEVVFPARLLQPYRDHCD